MEKWELLKGDERTFAKIKINGENLHLSSLNFKSEDFEKENKIAKLIASAPEMLEMLEMCKEKLLRVESPKTSCLLLAKQIDLLISKITD